MKKIKKSIEITAEGLDWEPHEDRRIACMEVLFLLGTDVTFHLHQGIEMDIDSWIEKISSVQSYISETLELTKAEIAEASTIMDKFGRFVSSELGIDSEKLDEIFNQDGGVA